MPLPVIRKFPVTLDKQRHLMYDVNANIAFEQIEGRTLIEVMAEIGSEMTRAAQERRPPKMPAVSLIRTLLWAGLRSETLDDKGNETADTLSLHQVGALLDFGTMMDTLNQIAHAFHAGMEGLPERSAGNPQRAPVTTMPNRSRKAKRSGGKRSGASRK